MLNGGVGATECVMRPENRGRDRAPLIFYVGFITAVALVVLFAAYQLTGDLGGILSVGGPGR